MKNCNEVLNLVSNYELRDFSHPIVKTKEIDMSSIIINENNFDNLYGVC